MCVILNPSILLSSKENCLRLLEERTINISHIHSKTIYKIFGNTNNDGNAIFQLCLPAAEIKACGCGIYFILYDSSGMLPYDTKQKPWKSVTWKLILLSPGDL